MQRIQNSIMSARRREIVAFPLQEASKTGNDFMQMASCSTLLSLLETLDYIQRLNEALKRVTKTLNVSSLFGEPSGNRLYCECLHFYLVID